MSINLILWTYLLVHCVIGKNPVWFICQCYTFYLAVKSSSVIWRDCVGLVFIESQIPLWWYIKAVKWMMHRYMLVSFNFTVESPLGGSVLCNYSVIILSNTYFNTLSLSHRTKWCFDTDNVRHNKITKALDFWYFGIILFKIVTEHTELNKAIIRSHCKHLFRRYERPLIPSQSSNLESRVRTPN